MMSERFTILLGLLTVVFLFCACGVNTKLSKKEQVQQELSALATARLPWKRVVDDEGYVQGANDLEEVFDSEPETLVQEPSPQFRLLFSCGYEDKNCGADGVWEQTLPESGTQIINRYWVNAIKFHYLNRAKYDKFSEQEKDHLANVHREFMEQMESELGSIEIVTPKKKRFISQQEMGQIVKQMNVFAQEVVDKGLKTKKYQHV